MISPVETIRAKRDGKTLTTQSIESFVDGVVSGTWPDYQISALLMAIYFQGLTPEETATLTNAMLHSGDVLTHSVPGKTVDKHSTGGVGDKISIPLAPAAAACGVYVPMIAGRGLGHTGGTLDKLEAIAGFNVHLDSQKFCHIVAEHGACIGGQTGSIAPADKKLYALRDVTGTVPAIPLIAASILSKKLAEGIEGLVLDCKVGAGAFMKDVAQGRKLAKAITAIGKAAGKKVSVVLTDMNAPIGRMIGNALEIKESIETLKGQGPADTRELTCQLGGEMLFISDVASSTEEGADAIAAALDDGRAAQKFAKMIEAQGGNPNVVDNPEAVLESAPHKLEVKADKSGVIATIDSMVIGLAGVDLGAGRHKAEDDVDFAVGIELLASVGDSVERGQPLAILHYRDRGVESAQKRCQTAFTVAESAQPLPSRILEVLRG